MTAGKRIASFSTRHPRLITGLMVQLTVIIALLAALPTIWPARFAPLNPLRVDTDPENMLPADEPVRVFHDAMKREMALYDMVVVGIVNDHNPDGVFNVDSLQRVYDLTQFARQLRWADPEHPDKTEGVLEIDVIAPSTVDNIQQGAEPGSVNFEWLMREPPSTPEDARAVRARARRIPFLDGTLVSEDGRALCLYLPLTSKDLSSRVYDAIRKETADWPAEDQVYVTGLPVAEDVFGVEMFKQMAVSAPLAMLVIFLLMLAFFRKISLVVSPMIVALVSVISTMGLLVMGGHTVHIMSSMIPIFIMPIAVLDAVHILSEFFDRYQVTRDREQTIVHVMDELFWPMLYTSLTTAVGFGSLALTPIPPVQVFGIFVAIGVLLAWVWTIVFIPAYVMFLKPESLTNFGVAAGGNNAESGLLIRGLRGIGRLTVRRARVVAAIALALSAVAVYGIFQIRINDNPIKWFKRSHPIRVADRVLNDHFGGTYMAYLALEPKARETSTEAALAGLLERLAAMRESGPQDDAGAKVFDELRNQAVRLGRVSESPKAMLDALETLGDERLFQAPEDEAEAWDQVMDFLASERSREQTFKQPEVLRFIARLQEHLRETGVVGKSNSLTDIVKTVRRELVSGQPEDFIVPDTASGVAQTLLQYQNSHRPQDLWHFVTPDFRKSVLWIQLTSGDNREMEKVVRSVECFMNDTEPPAGVDLRARWFGLTYINVIWQNKMVAGMLNAFLGSFLIVFLMMTVLYRSALWGLLSMVPLTVTIGIIYGAIGLVGKDYDMPVAVLSSLSLGLAVDYAIHFLSRSRQLVEKHGSWKDAVGAIFGEPARAITRNVFVIGLGFLPLLAAPLVPYRTVGVFIAAILFLAGVASLLLLPALMTLLEPFLFPATRKRFLLCQCGTCILSMGAITVLVALNIYRFVQVGWTAMTWISLGVILVLSQVCWWIGKSRRCKTPESEHGPL